MNIYHKLSISILIYLLLAVPSFAQNITLSLSPVTKEINLKPGETEEIKIMAIRKEKNNIPLEINIYPFFADGKEGSIELRKQDEISKNWITLNGQHLPQKTILDTSKINEFNFIVTAPEKSQEGDYYLAVLFSVKEDNNSERKALIIDQKAQIASLLLINVSQNSLPPTLSINNFSSPLFFTNAPVDFNIEIENKGRSLVKIKGIIEIKNFLGQKVDTIVIPSHTILRDSQRTIKNFTKNVSWLPENHFGPFYTANLTILDNKTNKTIAFKKYPVIPLSSIVVSIVIFIVLIFTISRIRKKSLKK